VQLNDIAITTKADKDAEQPSPAREASDAGGLLPATPPALRVRIVSGMRWTLWLSVLAAPFSYGTSIILARTGPEVIGTYGLLIVYIGLVSSLFYFGGDAVVIKFVPELEPGIRLAFLASYFLVTTLALAPWLAAASLWPEKLHYLFGDRAGARFQLLVLYLAPIYIIFSLIVAALKATLDMRWAHTLLRVLTIGAFLLYSTLFLGARALLKNHYVGLIWGIYLSLAVLASMLGLWRLLHLEGWRRGWRSLHFFLPRGFWRYTLSLEQVSAINFLTQRLDLILVLNFGGLAVLGKYVAIITLAEIIRAANRLFLDTLLPSLTNLLASRNLTAASELFSTNLRILFAVNLAATCALMFVVGPITALLGPQYSSLRTTFVLMIMWVGLSAPGGIGGTLLTSAGKQQRAVWVGLGQLGLYTALFLSLWPRWQLLGAVAACGVSLLLSNIGLLAVAKRSAHIRFSAAADYLRMAVVVLAAAAASLLGGPLGIALGLVVWAGSVALFLALANYGFEECSNLLACFLPGFSRTGRLLQGRLLRLRQQGLRAALRDLVRSFTIVYDVRQCDLASGLPAGHQSPALEIRVGSEAAEELARQRLTSGWVPISFQRDLVGDAGATCFLALIEERMAGVLWTYDHTRPSGSLRLGAGEVELCDLCTLKEFRGRGVAKALIIEACRRFRDRGFARAYTYLRPDNVASCRAFQAAGFRKVGSLIRPVLFRRRYVTDPGSGHRGLGSPLDSSAG
jgi:O-antigen/teichoic acid export membrane protein/ribosomal protein S18 acetylase RimI-like enzyme